MRRLGCLRPWLPLVAGAVVVLAVAAAVGLSAIEAASKGPAYRLTDTCLRVNERARRLLGVVTGSGFTVEGSVIENADGTGSARIDFHVNGSWRGGDRRVHPPEHNREGRPPQPPILQVARSTYPI